MTNVLGADTLASLGLVDIIFARLGLLSETAVTNVPGMVEPLTRLGVLSGVGGASNVTNVPGMVEPLTRLSVLSDVGGASNVAGMMDSLAGLGELSEMLASIQLLC